MSMRPWKHCRRTCASRWSCTIFRAGPSPRSPRRSTARERCSPRSASSRGSGASASALEVQPDFGIGLDVTIAFDTPGAKPQEQCTRLGEGVAIKIMDSSVICDYRMVEFMKSVAAAKKIRWQPEILRAGGTDHSRRGGSV